MKERDIFAIATELDTQAERQAFLEAACYQDAGLRNRIEVLLHDQADLGSFLEPPSTDHLATVLERALTEGPGTVIGPYKLLEQIGDGGFGVVFMAEQKTSVKRQVALKVIKPGMDTKEVVARFEAERQALAMMDHVNIARVLDAGSTESGRPYFVMELVHGVPITRYCDDNQLTVHQRLELFVPVCQAIQHAHQKGVIHRDIKPSNVMVTLYDGKPVPKVIDFGVAKAIDQRLTERTLFTAYGTMVGTLEYMSPEQAEMSALGVDTRSDIFSLGVLLYELLTGTTPLIHKRVQAAAYADVLRMIKDEEPPKPSTRLTTFGETLALISAQRRAEPTRLAKLIRGELDWIVMKALEKDRTRRYESASGLATDVLHFLADEPVSACPPSAAYQFRKFSRRHKAALATASVVGLALLVAVAASARSALLIAREQKVTGIALEAETRAKDDLEKTLRRERQDSYFHRIALAHRELAVNDLGRALQLLNECPEDLREWEWHYLMRLCRVDSLVIPNSTEVKSIAFSPDGKHLASAGGDGAIKIWNSRTCAVVQTLMSAHSGFVSSVAFHSDGQHLASVGSDKQVKVWDLTTGLTVFSRPCDAVHAYGTAYAAAFSSDGRQLAAGQDGAVNLWDWTNDRLLWSYPGHGKRQISVTYSSDEKLATGAWSGTVKLWNAQSEGRPIYTLAEPPESHHPISALSFSLDATRLAAASYDRRVDVWDTTTGEHLHALPHSGLVLCVAFSPDGRRLASAGEDKTVRLWDATTGREVLGLRDHTGMCGCVAFSPDGQRLASASRDGTIRIWDATPLEGNESQELLTFQGHGDEIWSLAVSPDGRQVVSAGFSTPAMVWDRQTGQVKVEFRGHEDIVFCVAWHPDGEQIASAGGNRGIFSVNVWDAQTGKETFVLPGTFPGGPEFLAVAFSPDGHDLVTGGASRSVQVWNARTGEEVGTVGTHAVVVRGVVFSRDGLHLASASDDGIVKLWDATRLRESQKALHELQARIHGQCLNVAFSRDGQRLITGGKENTVQVWDVQTGHELQTLRGHNGDVYTVAFSPDPVGRWIASAGEDSTVRLWNSQTGQPVHTFRGHVGLVSNLAFTPDGRQLVSGSRDHTVKVWDITPWEDMSDQ